jgi:hypothetical protein
VFAIYLHTCDAPASTGGFLKHAPFEVKMNWDKYLLMSHLFNTNIIYAFKLVGDLFTELVFLEFSMSSWEFWYALYCISYCYRISIGK